MAQFTHQPVNTHPSEEPQAVDDYIISSLTQLLAVNSRIDKKCNEYITRMLVIACCSPHVSSAFEKIRVSAERQLDTYRQHCIHKSNVQTLLRVF